MTARESWPDMFRLHTCFEAACRIATMPGALPDAASVRLENEAPPCRACRAWLRRAHDRSHLGIEVRWPQGVWRLPGSVAIANEPPHLRLLGENERQVNGMTLIAEENQRLSIWGCDMTAQEKDPPMLQADLVDGEYGPWHALGETRSQFLSSLGYWNAANGGAPVTAFGEAGPGTKAMIKALPIVWRATDFIIKSADGAFIAASNEPWVYIFGEDLADVEDAVASLELQWSDIEVRAGRD